MSGYCITKWLDFNTFKFLEFMMKRKAVVLVLGLSCLLSCKAQLSAKTAIDTTIRADTVSLEAVKAHLAYLASDVLEGRATGSPGIEDAAVYLETVFKDHGIAPYFKTYRDSFNLDSITGYNIVGYLEGNAPELKDQFVILGAHYDHIGMLTPIDGDSIANGANDDASGTAAVLEWAKYFAKTKSNKRSILFTLYAAEELGLRGSSHLAKRLKEKALHLYTMLNFEMIGVPRAAPYAMSYVTGYKKSNIAEQLNRYAGSKVTGFLPTAQNFNLFSRSDNYPFYNTFNVPAHAISTFDFSNFEYYHHVDDEVDKIDFNHVVHFIEKMIPAIEGMVNTTQKEIRLRNE